MSRSAVTAFKSLPGASQYLIAGLMKVCTVAPLTAIQSCFTSYANIEFTGVQMAVVVEYEVKYKDNVLIGSFESSFDGVPKVGDQFPVTVDDQRILFNVVSVGEITVQRGRLRMKLAAAIAN